MYGEEIFGKRWIPAFAGMTYEEAGMTGRGGWKNIC